MKYMNMDKKEEIKLKKNFKIFMNKKKCNGKKKKN